MQEKTITSPIKAKQLQRALVAYSAIGIFTISAVVAIATSVPLYQRLRQGETRNLQSALKTRTLVVEEFLSRAKDISQQIASRARVRSQLEAYNQGQINREQLLEVSGPILTEALNQSEDLAGITRLDRNNQLALQVGLPIPPELWPIPAKEAQTPLVRGPVLLQDETYIVVGVPILNSAAARVGTDIILIKVSSLQRAIQDYTGLGNTGETVLGAVRNDRVQLFFPLRNQQRDSDVLEAAIAQAVSSNTAGFLKTDDFAGERAVIAFEPISGSNWGLAIAIDDRELYASVNQQLVWVGVGIALLSLLGTGGMILLLRPLAGQAIVQTDELERQVQEKMDLLAIKTAALHSEQSKRALLEEALAQMDELRASSRQVAEQALAVDARAKQALNLSQDGTNAVSHTLDGMTALEDTVSAIAQQIKHLNDRSQQISAIASLVSELANQTNMLALNAAVEAVRAGEYGQGFAVVAAEIRKLADQSRQSAAQIDTLIAEIQTAVRSTTVATEKGDRTVKQGVQISKSTANVFNGVRQAIDEVVVSSQSISLSTQQQAAAIQQVVETINAIDSKSY